MNIYRELFSAVNMFSGAKLQRDPVVRSGRPDKFLQATY